MYTWLCQEAVVTGLEHVSYVYLYTYNWLSVTENSDLSALNVISVIFCMCVKFYIGIFFLSYS